MASPVDRTTVSLKCSGNSPAGLLSKMTVNIAALTAGNIASQQTKVAALATATSNLSTANLDSYGIAVETPLSASYPALIANRGDKWILTAQNGNGRKFTYTIPAAQATGNVLADNFTADLASTSWAAFKTAFEAVATDPVAAALTLISAKLGGRRR